MKEDDLRTAKITRLNRLIDLACGAYSRIARRLGVHRTYVSRVARGERESPSVENALASEYDRIQKNAAPLQE